ncbi:hypothetical protein FSP39_021281 [Pinctada imbricata]|uniref:Nudix hydrolase domain-containing protein n=1 Tax=Pinctada imbricata TaxID=66713 RepID=A0AA89BMD2_PINIB|nr:hypothetical protein FSP39_021281 [Pinctada imbricata]
MAAILKHWREAATLILVAKTKATAAPLLSNVTKSECQLEKSLFNYKLLMLKRSRKSTFMPNLYVFPGGTADDADFAADWLDVFKKSCDTDKLFSFLKTGGVGPYMFSRSRAPEFQHIPGELAFRICAIRETFEESGVLLVRDATRKVTPNESDQTLASVSNFSKDELQKWRQRVDKDPKEFLRLCKELKVVPDVWSLYEWSNWLTPLSMSVGKRSGRRYDTAFYICVLDHIPDAVQDNKETVHAQWASPDSLIADHFNEESFIAPPQVYELLRLFNFQDADKLHQFSVERTSKRVNRYFPVQVNCTDGVAILYPGDEWYPENPDFEGEKETMVYNGTVEEASKVCKRRNRHHPIKPENVNPTDCNIVMTDGHVSPITDPSVIQGVIQAKL